MSQYASAKHSIAECDRCGFRYKLLELKPLTIKLNNVNIRVCPECYEEDHPQLQVGMYPVYDPQAVENARPDTTYYDQSGSRKIQWGWNPVGGARGIDKDLTPNDWVATAQLGSVTVT